MDELAEIFADLGFSVAEGPEIEDAMVQFHRAQHAREPSGAGDAGHLLSRAAHGRTRSRGCCAPTPRRCRSGRCRRTAPPLRIIAPGPRLSLRQRRDPHADVPPGRGAGDRPRDHARPPQMDAGDLPQGLLRARRRRAADAPVLLPVHRAVGRGRRRLVDGEGPPRGRRAAKAGWKCWAAAWSTRG